MILLKLYFIRKIKALFVKFKFHILIKPFEHSLLNLVYLSKLSNWISNHRQLRFNDFYNRKVVYADRFKLHQFVIDNEIKNDEFDYLEFGVAEGTSIKWWAEKIKNPNCRFYGFDVFTGLPEDFAVMKKKDYDTKGKTPNISDHRIKFICGLFQDSFPGFLKNNELTRKKIIHLDADLYSSTLFVLTSFHPILNTNDIIIFDEFGVPTYEFRAFLDFLAAYNMKFEVIGAINNYLQLALIIK
jgi:hypothetical protein